MRSSFECEGPGIGEIEIINAAGIPQIGDKFSMDGFKKICEITDVEQRGHRHYLVRFISFND